MSAAEEAYRNLVAAARAEGGIAPEEQRILNAYVLRLGLEAGRAREIQAAAEAESPPRIRVPKEDRERIDTLRAVLEVVAADGKISPRELAVVRALADRMSVAPRDLDGLVSVALRGKKASLDRALAELKPAPAETEVEFAEKAGAPSGGTLRALPFVARLAPAVRSCAYCGKSFAARDRYEMYCRICRHDLTDDRSIGRRGERLTGTLFLLLLVPAAFALEYMTGLWSWGYVAMLRSVPPLEVAHRSGERSSANWAFIVPAVALTAALSWAVAWPAGALYMAALRRAGVPGPPTS